MAKAGRSLTDLAAEIERRALAKKDFVAPTNKLQMTVADNKPAFIVGDEQFAVGDTAHGQLAEFAGIPMAYYRRMIVEDPSLLALNVNRWLKDMGDKRRTVRTLDGSVRAVLSDSYRALENEDLAEAILPVLLGMDLLILSCEITERRLYIKAVDKSIEQQLPTGRRMGDGVDHKFFDVLSPAISISNSEIGFGALSIETGIYTRACTNLAMLGTNMRKYHTGKRAELSDDVYALLTDETRKATDNAVWLQTRDLVKSAFDQAKFAKMTARLESATKVVFAIDSTIQVIENVARRFSFNDTEKKSVLTRLIEGNDFTKYGVHSAVTRVSQEDVIAYDRATEMERIGGEIIEMDAGELFAVPMKARKGELALA